MIYIYIYTYTYTHTYIHACIHTYMHAYIPTYLPTYIHIYAYICVYIYLYIHVYIYIFEHVQSDFTFVRTYLSAHTYVSAYMQEYVYYAQALWLCWRVCACSTYSCYLLCCVMVGMCLAAASWQSKNGLLATLPHSQPVAGLRLHHLQLLPAVAQRWCLMVEMRLVVARWQSKNCLLRYSRSKLRILIKVRCVVAELCWSGPFRSRPRSIPVPDPDHPCTTPDGWTNGRFSHRLLLDHPLRVGYGSLESCYAGTQCPP